MPLRWVDLGGLYVIPVTITALPVTITLTSDHYGITLTVLRRLQCKPLETVSLNLQLANWLKYLDFMEKKGNATATLIVYERCLVPCASYPGEMDDPLVYLVVEIFSR